MRQILIALRTSKHTKVFVKKDVRKTIYEWVLKVYQERGLNFQSERDYILLTDTTIILNSIYLLESSERDNFNIPILKGQLMVNVKVYEIEYEEEPKVSKENMMTKVFTKRDFEEWLIEFIADLKKNIYNKKVKALAQPYEVFLRPLDQPKDTHRFVIPSKSTLSHLLGISPSSIDKILNCGVIDFRYSKKFKSSYMDNKLYIEVFPLSKTEYHNKKRDLDSIY